MSLPVSECSVAADGLHAYLLEQAYEPLIAWELDGTVIYWNRAAEELYGFTSAQAQGTCVHQLLGTTHPIPLEEILAQVKTQSMWSGELSYRHSDGSELCIDSRLILIEVPGHAALVLQSDRDNSVYKQAETAMRQVYEELEQRVDERTRDLASANKELESFSYSVSHDLRAPLRSLEGFTRILMLDYAGKVVDDRALELMRRMTASVARMGQLIEDLLKLSQVTRTVIHPQELDLTAMATTILDDLRARDPERVAEMHVEPGMTAVADPGLLRAVLENLLGNAWKFSGKMAAARIAVGVTRTAESDTTYFIQDNGAGFDMEFADQLFAPFQRLHRATEFEGTGVGLATVQRVIHRHGGRIWAESSPGKGAKFFFTLAAGGKARQKKG
jgi:PAS domain S-box-containing protein